MAIKLSSLFVALGANSAELEKAFASTRKKANKWGKDIGKVGASTAKVFAGVAAGVTAAAGGLSAIVAANAPVIDNLGKTADKLGETTEGLQNQRLAANLAGIATNEFDTGLQRMVRRLAEAAEGTGVAVKPLQQLNLSAKELSTLRPEESLSKILDGLNNIPNSAERVRLAFQFFDSGGVKFVNLTSEAIENANDLLTKMGGHLSRLDVKKVEEMNDSFTLLKSVVGVLGQDITVKLAEPLKIVADGFFNAAFQSDQFGQFTQKAANLATRGLASFLDYTGGVLNFIDANPGVFKYGVIGAMLFGVLNKNKILGGAIGVALAQVYNKAKAFFDFATGGEEGRLDAQIAQRKRTIAWFEEQKKLTDEETADHRRLQIELGQLLRRREDMARAAALLTDQVNMGLDETTTKAVSLGDTMKSIAGDLRNSLTNTVDSAAGPLTSPPGAPVAGGPVEDPDANDDANEAKIESERDFLARQLAIYSEFAQSKGDVMEQTKNRIVAYSKEERDTWARFTLSGAKTRTKILYAETQDALSTLGERSRKAFELNKAASLASAFVSTYQAAASAMATQPFWPTGLAMLAVALVKGAAIISNIRSAKFGDNQVSTNVASGSATPVSSVSGSTATTAPAVAVPDAAESSAEPVVMFNVFGVDELIDRTRFKPLMLGVVEDAIASQELFTENQAGKVRLAVNAL